MYVLLVRDAHGEAQLAFAPSGPPDSKKHIMTLDRAAGSPAAFARHLTAVRSRDWEEWCYKARNHAARRTWIGNDDRVAQSV